MKYVISAEIREEDNYEATAIIRLSERMEVFSCAPLNGGEAVTDTIFIMQVPHDFSSRDYIPILKEKARFYHLPDDAVGFMTAAEVRYVFNDVEKEVDGTEVYVAATAGVTNCVCAGDELIGWEHKSQRSKEIYERLIAGTINIVAVSPLPLSLTAKVNLLAPITEAKALAMHDLGYLETGTTSDATAVVSPIGTGRLDFAGTGTPLGMAVARAVREAVASCIRDRGESPEPQTALQMLAAKGISEDMVWDCASACGLGEGFRDQFEEVLGSMSSDPDICALVYAILRAGSMAEKNCICNQPDGELPEVLVDGTLPMFLAGRISETRGSDTTIDLLRLRPLKDAGLPEYVENLTYGLVAGVVGYITGFSDERSRS